MNSGKTKIEVGLSITIVVTNIMGGDGVWIETSKFDEFKNYFMVWHIFYEGEVSQYVERINSYDEGPLYAIFYLVARQKGHYR